MGGPLEVGALQGEEDDEEEGDDAEDQAQGQLRIRVSLADRQGDHGDERGDDEDADDPEDRRALEAPRHGRSLTRPGVEHCRVLDERWIRSLHVESMRRADLHAEREPHVLFQASTIGALLDGAFDGDLSFAELAEHGDLGLGTLNAARRRDDRPRRRVLPRRRRRRGSTPVAPEERTPVRGRHRSSSRRSTRGSRSGLGHDELLARLDALAPAERLLLRDPPRRPLRARPRPLGARARSRPTGRWPRSSPTSTSSSSPTSRGRCSASASPPTSRGSRSPATTCTSSATTAAAAATCSTRARAGLRVRLDPSDDLHVELPPAVELADPDLAAATHAAIDDGRGRLAEAPSAYMLASAALQALKFSAGTVEGVGDASRPCPLKRDSSPRWS